MKYVLDSHTHTIASGHAYNTMNEMVQAAADKGLELLGITEHGTAMPGTCCEYHFMNLKVLPRRMAGIEVLFGAEANIVDFDGRLDMSERILRELDVVIASIHLPCIRHGNRRENTAALIGAMKNPYVGIIGHPDDGRFSVDYEEIVRAAKEYHVLLEINNTSLSPHSYRQNARENDKIMLDLCCRFEVPVILDSDAHWSGDIGNCCYSKPLIEETGFPEELIINSSVKEYKKYVNCLKTV